MCSANQFLKKYTLYILLLATPSLFAYPLSFMMRQGPTSQPFAKLNADQLGAMSAAQLRQRKAELSAESRRLAAKSMSFPALKMELRKTEQALEKQEKLESQKRRFGLRVTKQLPTLYGAVPYTQAQPRMGVAGAWDRMWSNSADIYGVYYKDLASEKAEQKKQQAFAEKLKEQAREQDRKEREQRIAASRQNELFRQAEENKQRAAIDQEIKERQQAREKRAAERKKEIEKWQATPEYKKNKAAYQAWERGYEADLAREQAEEEAQEAARLRPFNRLRGGVPQWQLDEEERWLEEQSRLKQEQLDREVNAALEDAQKALAEYKEEQRKKQLEKEKELALDRWRLLKLGAAPVPPPLPSEKIETAPKELEAGMGGMRSSEVAGSAGVEEAGAQALTLTPQELAYEKKKEKMRADLVQDLAAYGQKLEWARSVLRNWTRAQDRIEAEKFIQGIDIAKQALEDIKQIPESLPVEEKDALLDALFGAYSKIRERALSKEEKPGGQAIAPEPQELGLVDGGLLFDPKINQAILALQANIKNLESRIGTIKRSIGYKVGLSEGKIEEVERGQQEIAITRAAVQELNDLPQGLSAQEKREHAQAILDGVHNDIEAMRQARDLAKQQRDAEKAENARRIEQLRKQREQERAD